jgi:signal transduction histidine kinase
MTIAATRNAISPLGSVVALWRVVSAERNLRFVVALIVLGASACVCRTVGNHIEEVLANKTAASIALYMDSFVEPIVQELATRTTLSPESRTALGRLFEPATIGRPVVSFRIWITDEIVFSSRGDLIGKHFRSTLARKKAFEGEVVAGFGLEGDDDEHERALGVPILQIYAPVRQTGTNRIIALAETAELATSLTQEIRAAQYASYATIVSAAMGLVFLIFKLTSGLQNRIGKLAEQQVENLRFRSRVCRAHSHALEMSERNFRDLSERLHTGPLQLIALAQLRFGALFDDPERYRADVDVIKKALSDCTKQLRDVLAGVAPVQLEQMSLIEVITTSVCLRDRVTVTSDLRDLPETVPYLIKSCIYQILEQAIRVVLLHTPNARVHVRAWSDIEKLNVTLDCDGELSKPVLWLAKEIEDGTQILRHLVEALGGALAVQARGDEDLTVAANFWICD